MIPYLAFEVPLFKFIPALVLLVIVSCAASPISKAQKVYDQVLPSVVKVEAIQDDGPSTCAGVVVDASAKEVLTARHCVGEPSDPVLVDGLASEVVKVNKYYALIRTPELDKTRIILSNGKVEITEKVYSLGYGYGRMTFLIRRVIWQDKDGDIVIDGLLFPGMSGGPTVNSNGELIGINQMASNETNTGLMTGVQSVKDFLK